MRKPGPSGAGRAGAAGGRWVPGQGAKRLLGRQARAAEEEQRRQRGQVRRYVSGEAKLAYLAGITRARAHLGRSTALDDIYADRLRGQRGVARRVNRLVSLALAAGLVGMAATLVLPWKAGRGTPRGGSRIAHLMEERAGIARRWKARMGARVQAALILWSMEPQVTGRPHWHVLAMVSPGQTDLAFDCLRRSVHRRQPCGRDRLAKPEILTRSEDLLPVKHLVHRPDGRPGWVRLVRYMLKARIWSKGRLDQLGYADLLTTQAWVHANGVGRSLIVPTWKQATQAIARAAARLGVQAGTSQGTGAGGAITPVGRAAKGAGRRTGAAARRERDRARLKAGGLVDRSVRIRSEHADFFASLSRASREGTLALRADGQPACPGGTGDPSGRPAATAAGPPAAGMGASEVARLRNRLVAEARWRRARRT